MPSLALADGRSAVDAGTCSVLDSWNGGTIPLRTVGRAWSRVIWRCSQDRTPYNPARHRGLRQHITVLIPTQAEVASADVHPYAWRGAGLRPGARPARTGAA